MKFIPYIKFILLILGIVAFLAGVSSWDSTNPNAITGGLDFLFTIAAAFIVITVVASVLMPTFALLQNPKAAKSSLLGLLLVAAMFIVAYSMSSSEPITLASGKVMDSVGELKFADTSLYAMYITFAGVILSIVGTEIYKIFK
ncbi:MAG: hypothetical protein SNH27_14020 [Rikenellaceae bacterium]